jgi:hypothetical protein
MSKMMIPKAAMSMISMVTALHGDSQFHTEQPLHPIVASSFQSPHGDAVFCQFANQMTGFSLVNAHNSFDGLHQLIEIFCMQGLTDVFSLLDLFREREFSRLRGSRSVFGCHVHT